jgi:chorismate lyase / 3-hydroxybenzoate synthase
MLTVRTAKFAGRLPDETLCCFRFAGEPVSCSDPRVVNVQMAPLDSAVDCEIWLGSGPVEMGRHDGFQFAHDGDTLIASRVLPADRCGDLEQITRSSYLHMDALLRRCGYPHWQRMWNYLARINEGDGDDERYRRFNAGRFAAVALRGDSYQTLPAASGVGSGGEQLVLACIAGRHAAQQIENPRQLSAFHYPRQYGLRAPLFSRAALVPNSPGAQLLISGTASIVGHESQHLGDVTAQLAETVDNLRALLTETLRQHAPGADPANLKPESLRVYLRRADDLATVAAGLARWVVPQQPTVYVQAEICRRELLLEIEGTYQLPSVV